MKEKNNKGMTPFHFSLLYFMLIKHNVSSFIWFYCFFFRFVALFACVWKKSFSSSYFFYLVLLFVLFLIFFFLLCFLFFFLFIFVSLCIFFSKRTESHRTKSHKTPWTKGHNLYFLPWRTKSHNLYFCLTCM